MKKFLTFALVCCLVFSSSSTVFATATQWDTSDQANLRYIYQSVTSGGSLYTLVNNIYTRVNTISNTLTDIKSYLFDSNHDITYWVHAINTWMQPIYNAIQNTPTELESIKRLLGYVSYEGETEVIDPYLAYQSKGVAQYLYDEYQLLSANGVQHLLQSDGSYNLYIPNSSGTTSTIRLTGMNNRPWYSNTNTFLNELLTNTVRIYGYEFNHRDKGYNAAQSFTLWNGDSLTTSSFTPTSATNGIYNWLSKIQEPIARLSYVLASDQDIEAREKAAENQDAVVDNFIDSSGSGAASPSDIGTVSNLSSGFKDNISTDASVSGIWNIFNSDNFGWFSQETADQLDTSGSGNKTLRCSGSYPTPLLDKQTEDIMNILGGDDND